MSEWFNAVSATEAIFTAEVKAENVILKKKISSLCPKRVNQTIKCKNACIKQQHMELKRLKKEISKSNNVSVNHKLKLRITKLRKVVAKTMQPCRVQTHGSLQNKVKTLQIQVDDLQLELDKLNENNEGSQDKVKTKKGKTYTAQGNVSIMPYSTRSLSSMLVTSSISFQRSSLGRISQISLLLPLFLGWPGRWES